MILNTSLSTKCPFLTESVKRWYDNQNHCCDPAQSAIFDSSVDKLVEWLASQRTDVSLTLLLSEYLHSRGDVLISSLCTPRSDYYKLAEIVDSLGWDFGIFWRDASLRSRSMMHDLLISNVDIWINTLATGAKAKVVSFYNCYRSLTSMTMDLS